MTEDDLVVEDMSTQHHLDSVDRHQPQHDPLREDRITPAKVAMALAELVMVKYPKDTLDIVVFEDAGRCRLQIALPQVGPFHTNTVAGLERAMDILRRRKTRTGKIFDHRRQAELPQRA